MFEKLFKTQIEKQNVKLANWLKKHDKENPFPKDSIDLVENVSYINDDKACHKMDIYMPKDKNKKYPVIINIHGGGLLLGSKEVNRLFCADLCQRGFVVFCLEYPLIPEVNAFMMMSDLAKGLNYVYDKALEYNGDVSKFYLTGDSAGAYLAIYLNAIKNSEKLRKILNIKEIKPHINALGLISGMFYTNKCDEIGIFLPKMIYGKDYKKSPFKPYIDIENKEIIANLAPCYLITSKGDSLRKYSRCFAKCLKKNNIPYELNDIDNGKKLSHAFVAMMPEKEEAQEAIKKMVDFMLKY